MDGILVLVVNMYQFPFVTNEVTLKNRCGGGSVGWMGGQENVFKSQH